MHLPMVILAAGASRRFGSPKALAPWGETCVLGQVISTAFTTMHEAPWVVLGAHAEAIGQKLRTLRVPYKVIRHPAWDEGLSSSLRQALHELKDIPPTPAGLMVLLGDQPLIAPHELLTLIDCWQENPDYIVATKHADGPGAPCILPARVFPQVESLKGDQGARSLLRSDPKICLLPIPSAHWDIDTPADLAAAHSQTKESRPQ
jgi:molybdenum cofactor cytidylyltransferase